MKYGLLDLLTLIGSLGIFLYGMKLMSEALQKVAGHKMRTVLAAVTKNKFVGILSGVLVTSLIQSSSATTVMVVSFVNAGLLNLSQAFSVIMGANIGTTATAWIIALLGFKVDISTLAVPIIAFSLPLLFSKHANRRYIGEMILGFALLFMGIGLLKDSVPNVQDHPEILAFLQNYTGWGYGSVLLFLAIGTLLTIIVQSSSATMAITLVMCSQGWIPYELATAMILGENIGTTITANIAAIPANLSAKRAAFSHFIFNIFGVCWVLIVFYPYTHLIMDIVEKCGPTDPEEASAFALSLFHSMFNIINVLLLCWWSKYIILLVEKVIRPRKHEIQSADEETFQLAYISTGLLSTAELSIIQARKEISVYAKRVHRMYELLPELVTEKDVEKFKEKFEHIKKLEDVSDQIESEVSKYIASVTTGRLSSETKVGSQHLLRITSEIESVADACYKFACIVQHNREKDVVWSEVHWQKIQEMLQLVGKAVDEMVEDLQSEDIIPDEMDKAREVEKAINAMRDQLLNDILVEVNEGKCTYEESAFFQDAVKVLERAGDYVVNIVEAQTHQKMFKTV